MRVTVGTFVLCEGEAEDQYPDALHINGKRLTDILEFFRAANSAPQARGNRRTVITFDVERQHESHRAACEFAAKHEAEIPDTGDILFTFEGNGATVLSLTNGVVDESDCNPIHGLSTVHHYTLLGSRFGSPTS